MSQERVTTDRRRIERRAPKRGVNVRVGDEQPETTKRVKRGRIERERKSRGEA